MSRGDEQAFPIPEGYSIHRTDGMTLREYFAGLAMQGYLASWPSDAAPNPVPVAKKSVECADALLAELAKA